MPLLWQRRFLGNEEGLNQVLRANYACDLQAMQAQGCPHGAASSNESRSARPRAEERVTVLHTERRRSRHVGQAAEYGEDGEVAEPQHGVMEGRRWRGGKRPGRSGSGSRGAREAGSNPLSGAEDGREIPSPQSPPPLEAPAAPPWSRDDRGLERVSDDRRRERERLSDDGGRERERVSDDRGGRPVRGAGVLDSDEEEEAIRGGRGGREEAERRRMSAGGREADGWVGEGRGRKEQDWDISPGDSSFSMQGMQGFIDHLKQRSADMAAGSKRDSKRDSARRRSRDSATSRSGKSWRKGDVDTKGAEGGEWVSFRELVEKRDKERRAQERGEDLDTRTSLSFRDIVALRCSTVKSEGARGRERCE